MDPAEDFRSAMHLMEIDYCGPIHDDGKLHRIKAAGDREANAWYVLHGDNWPAGVFGCWRRGFTQIWHMKRECRPTDVEWQAIRAKWQESEREQKQADAEIKKAAREKARFIFSNSERVNPAHPYLDAKRVQIYGELRQYKGSLVLPLRDAAGALHSLQFIDDTGKKRFLPGGRIAGCFFSLSDTPGPLVICEGYATGASIVEATGYATVAAMNAGNLLATGKALRDKSPDREIIIAADNDTATPGNPGLTKATEAARMIHAKIAVPNFQTKGNP